MARGLHRGVSRLKSHESAASRTGQNYRNMIKVHELLRRAEIKPKRKKVFSNEIYFAKRATYQTLKIFKKQK